MKRVTLISAGLLLAFAGCTCGQGWRPNILTRLHNRIHGVSNVGAPCDAGHCESAVQAQPACESCGNSEAVQYGGYEGNVIGSYEGTPIGSYNSYNNVPTQTYVAPTQTVGARFGTAETVVPKSSK
jgi:hypothetical protein